MYYKQKAINKRADHPTRDVYNKGSRYSLTVATV